MGLVREDRRAEMCERPVTLDGKRAMVTGYKNRFATVRAFGSGNGGPVEFAWETVERVVANGGDFRS